MEVARPPRALARRPPRRRPVRLAPDRTDEGRPIFATSKERDDGPDDRSDDLDLHDQGTKAAPIDTHLSLCVADVDATVAALKAKGVAIASQPYEVCEGLRSASFRDPFGNTYHFCGK